MELATQTKLLGYVQLRIGSHELRVPICAREGYLAVQVPTAEFAVEGERCAIIVQGDPSSDAMDGVVQEAAQEAVRHWSRKLLN